MEALLTVAGLLVGMVGLAPVCQMLFGRPNLTFWTDEFAGANGRILVFALKNEEVRNRFLRLMRVEREPRDVQVFFDIQEQGTRRFLIRAASGLLNNVARQAISLRTEATPGFTVAATIIATRDGTAEIVEGRTQNNVPIPQGHYVAAITVLCGNRQYNFREQFQIGQQDHQTIWPNRGPVQPLK